MSAEKYRIGDTVIILSKDGLMENESQTYHGVTDDMCHFAGVSAKIVYKTRRSNPYYILDVDNGIWGWEDEMFVDAHIDIEKSELSKILEI